jgi:Dolichyl-phosphate-mannose-protein mannosyltransferase
VTLRRAAAAAALASAAFALFVVSRGKWSDPLIDSGREWIVPDALSRGELLYRDVVYWFGPVTPYFQAAFFRIFGSSFATLVFAGAVIALATLAALYAVVRAVTDRRSAILWTALAIPALVFMPNAGGALLGMGYRIWQAAAFALASVALAARPPKGRGVARAFAAGLFAALAGLCRTEWGLAAIAAAALACLLRTRRRARGARHALAATLGFVAAFFTGLGAFVLWAGSNAVLRDGPVLLLGLPAETRQSLAILSGRLDWKAGIAELLYSAAAWTGLLMLSVLLSRPTPADRRRAVAVLAGSFAVLLAAAAGGGAGGAVLFSAAPFVCAVALLAGLRRGHGSGAAALAACGLLGLVLSYRRPFHIGDAAYVAPPLLFALACGAGLARLETARARGRSTRARLAAILRWAVAATIALAFAGRASHFATMDERPIAGTAGMLSARPELAREIEDLASAIRARTAGGDGLVVFPEGELLNFLTGRRNPLRHRLYLPGYLTEGNELEVLRELERSAPAAIVLWRRPVTEYDRALFGEDYGLRIRAWIESNYRSAPIPRSSARVHSRFLLFLRGTA